LFGLWRNKVEHGALASLRGCFAFSGTNDVIVTRFEALQGVSYPKRASLEVNAAPTQT
jgi:hypothetical protein